MKRICIYTERRKNDECCIGYNAELDAVVALHSPNHPCWLAYRKFSPKGFAEVVREAFRRRVLITLYVG